MIQSSMQPEYLQKVINIFPDTMFKSKKVAGLSKDEFQKFVACPKCNKLYTYDSAMYRDRYGKTHAT